MERVKFNPIDAIYKSEIGAAEKKTKQRYSLFINAAEKHSGVHFCVTPEDRPEYRILMKKTAEKDGFIEYSCEFTYLTEGLYWYHFSFWNGEKTTYVGKNRLGLGEIMNNPLNWQQTVTVKNLSSNALEGKLIYQIFPDRFRRSGKISVRSGGVYHEDWFEEPIFERNGKIKNDDFFGGNFDGIIEKIDYLKSLNVSYIYLNPIFEAQSNHKYDVGDYEKIDACFGDEKKFIELIEKCRKVGIGIIIDGVFNHVGADGKYFNRSKLYKNLGAYNSKKSPYYPWFTFKDYPNDYLCWWDVPLLPCVNENAPSFVKFITAKNGVIDKYFKMGVSGIRLDVADELPDEFLSKIKRAVIRNSQNAFVIGEVWEDASNKIAYGKRRKYFTENLLDSVMNYPWKEAVIDFLISGESENIYNAISEIVNNYPKNNLNSLMNILDTHDTVRIINALGGTKTDLPRKEDSIRKLTKKEYVKGKELLKMAAAIIYTLPGVPSLYYGDEAGLCGYGDPYNRRTYPWGKEDETLLDFYKKLGKLRDKECLKHGEIRLIYDKKGVLAYARGGKLLTVVNRSDKPYKLHSRLKECISGETTDTVMPDSFGIFEI